jgi:hypothetical protein
MAQNQVEGFAKTKCSVEDLISTETVAYKPLKLCAKPVPM